MASQAFIPPVAGTRPITPIKINRTTPQESPSTTRVVFQHEYIMYMALFLIITAFLAFILFFVRPQWILEDREYGDNMINVSSGKLLFWSILIAGIVTAIVYFFNRCRSI